MLRDLLVPQLRQASDRTALAFALALAEQHQSQIAALITVACPMPLVSEWGYLPAEVNEQAFEAARRDGDERASQLRTALAENHSNVEVRVAESLLIWPEDTLALHACHADLSVLGSADPGASMHRFSLSFKALLLRSGRPVLVVPQDWPSTRPLQHAVLAWMPTAQATRAMHEALPLLRHMKLVTVLMIDPVSTEAGHGAMPGCDISRHLARHDVPVELVAMPRQGASVGEAILQFVANRGADLLVMGGYGHSQWREAILGGTTRTVLEGLRSPVLFAH